MMKERDICRPMIGRMGKSSEEKESTKSESWPTWLESLKRKSHKPRPTSPCVSESERVRGSREKERINPQTGPQGASLCLAVQGRTSRACGITAHTRKKIKVHHWLCLLLLSSGFFSKWSVFQPVSDGPVHLKLLKQSALFPREVGSALEVSGFTQVEASTVVGSVLAVLPASPSSTGRSTLAAARPPPESTGYNRKNVTPPIVRPVLYNAQMSTRGKRVDELEELSSSIDRSRKRHLDEGLLRGDQVLDRLKVQEASASPLLKKTRKSPGTTPPRTVSKMAMTMAEFKEYMDNNTNKRLGDIDGKIGGMQTAIKENTAKLDRHEAQISELRGEMVKLKQAPFPPLPAPQGGPLDPLPLPPALVPDSDYLVARRSLRLWPVRGTSKDDLWNSAASFMINNLGLIDKLDNDSMEEVTRVTIPSGPGVSDEALVRFRTVAARDLVLGSASKLSTFMDRDGRATAGMRIEVPPKLQQAFRVLFKYGSNLRARHGAGTRRHVKFSDVDQSLYLNVKLPGDDSWSRVSLQVALRGMRARETLNDDQLERRLDITGPLQDARPRAHSTAGPPRPTEASAWMRRPGGSTSS